MVSNYALGAPAISLNSGTCNTRAVYKATDKGLVNAYVFNNTKAGYQFDPSIKETIIASPDLPSCWQMQSGLRYIF